jgi:hypothetical protein
VLKDDDLADDLGSLDTDAYARRKHLTISNPRRAKPMANGDNGDDDLDFSHWSKADCTAALTEIAQIASDAFDPVSSREELAQALGNILDQLSDDDDEDDDGEDDLDDAEAA